MSNPEYGGELLRKADLLAPSAIRAAATLGIVDHITAGVDDPAHLAELTGSRPDLMAEFLDYLVDLGLLAKREDKGFEVTDLGRPLESDSPDSIRELLRTDGLFGRADLALVDLVHTVRTGEPSHAAVFGRGYWQSVNEEPEFLAAMERKNAVRQGRNPDQLGWDTENIVTGYDWSRVGRVVDVGGHDGTILLELLDRHPHLHGLLVDLPNAVTVSTRRFAANGVADRAEAVVGDFFEPLPPGGDVYLLSAVLADWRDEDAVRILRRCGEAAGADGKVLLAEVNIAAPAAGMRLWLRATMPAPVRTVEQLKALGAAAGLRLTWEGPATPLRSLLEFSAAPAV
ncbi:methyltransferase [Kitasatospora sp. HPMI-4]|uniref:methyltransferase n=1 Tax=Kitasatospora sp. HPMI-4 TaxID=3448443 RepID=UPI003F198193